MAHEEAGIMESINLMAKYAQFSEQWSPKIIADLNDSYVKLAKVEGEFVWHNHENEDELFIVFKGHLTIALPEQTVELGEGEMFVVPKGMEHKPSASEETYIMLIEPKTTLHTGNIVSERTVTELARL